MKRYGKILVFLLCALLTPAFMLPAAAAAVPGDNDLFVSPDGDDSAAGTVGAPLRTVSAAKEKLKALKNAGEDYGHVHVWLRGGRYEFADTLYFTADDLPDVTKVQNFIEIMGYAGYTSGKEEDRRKLYISEVYPLTRKKDGKQFGYSVVTQSIGSGKTGRFSIMNSVWNKEPLKKGDVILCVEYVREGVYFRLTNYEKIYQ